MNVSRTDVYYERDLNNTMIEAGTSRKSIPVRFLRKKAEAKLQETGREIYKKTGGKWQSSRIFRPST